VIPFSKPTLGPLEHEYVAQALASGHLHGGGPFTRKCERWLEARLGCGRAIIVPSCTAALEMAALLFEIGPGDEVIMPSYTFVSTANAVALRGGVPVFVDIRHETLNIDEDLVEAAITPRTRALFPVHYAGTPCDLRRLRSIADRHGLHMAEDAAQALLSSHQGTMAGTAGHLGCLSFHSTKNVTCGEGGALLVNDPGLAARAEVLHEKGTDRSRFMRGEVDKYSWRDLGSSYVPSEVTAALLLAQLERAEELNTARQRAWDAYHEALAQLDRDGRLVRQVLPAGCKGNAHIFFVVLPTAEERDALLAHLRSRGIGATFHYVPLHSSPAGRRLGRAAGSLRNTDDLAARMVRLPLWPGIDPRPVVDAINEWSEHASRR